MNRTLARSADLKPPTGRQLPTTKNAAFPKKGGVLFDRDT
jgi:hypothetical protein